MEPIINCFEMSIEAKALLQQHVKVLDDSIIEIVAF